MAWAVFTCVISCSQGIEKIAWNASGERLAVSFKGGDEIYSGLIAIYDARRTPVVSASLVWVLHIYFSDGELFYSEWFNWCTDRVIHVVLRYRGFIRGPGDNPKPMTFSFHDKFKQGPLLSVVSLHDYNLSLVLEPIWKSALDTGIRKLNHSEHMKYSLLLHYGQLSDLCFAI